MQIRPWTLGANAFPESYQPQPPETGPTYSADAQADAESVKKLQKKKLLDFNLCYLANCLSPSGVIRKCVSASLPFLKVHRRMLGLFCNAGFFGRFPCRAASTWIGIICTGTACSSAPPSSLTHYGFVRGVGGGGLLVRIKLTPRSSTSFGTGPAWRT